MSGGFLIIGNDKYKVAKTVVVQDYRYISEPTTLLNTDYSIHILDGSFTQELPDMPVGKSFEFINTSLTGSVILQPLSGTINNNPFVTLPPGHSVTLKSTGLLTGITYIITSQY